jgi:hypothetical protein
MTARGRSFWIAQLGGWFTYAALFHLLTYAPTGAGGAGGAEAALRHFASKLNMAGLGLAVSSLLAVLYGRVWRRRLSATAWLALIVGVALPAGALWTVAYRFTYFLSLGQLPDWSDLPRSVLNYAIALVAWSALWLAHTYRREMEEATTRATEAREVAARAELQMLRYQIHPHFLFNSLNSLRALIDEDPTRARSMVTELADFFRYSLLGSSEGSATLEEELNAARSYLRIQRLRFESSLAVEEDVDTAALGARLPRLALHPLLENAIKFGRETSTPDLTLRIAATVAGGELCVEVTNSGRWLEPGTAAVQGTATGLANVRRRLAHLDPRARLDLEPGDGRVTARLRIPLAGPR